MTLFDLLKLLKRSSFFIALVTVVCGVAVLAFQLFLPSVYSATTEIVVAGDGRSVSNYARVEAANLGNASDSVSVAYDTNNNSVTISVSGANGEECVRQSNLIANNLRQNADLSKIIMAIIEAESAIKVSPNPIRNGIIGCFAGFFVAVFIVLTVEFFRGRIKSSADVENLLDETALFYLDRPQSGVVVLENIRFIAKETKSVALIPLGDSRDALLVSDILRKLAQQDQQATPRILPLQSFLQNSGALYSAVDAKLIFIVAREWVDTINTLKTTVEEANLIGAKVVGVILLPETYGGKKRYQGSRKLWNRLIR